MALEFITEEKATELGLTTEQLAALEPEYNNHVATLKKDWDGLANTNAEKIIDGAIAATAKKFNIELSREQGERNSDYLARLNDKVVETAQSNVTRLEKEYTEKLKIAGNGDATAKELSETKQKLDDANKILAGFDDIKVKADKYEETEQQLSGLKLQVAFDKARPSFPDTVNTYEAKAKWDEFKKSVLDKNTIELVEGEPMAIDKENQYKQTKLSELVKADKELSTLLEGRQQTGTGARSNQSGKNLTIEGISFDVPDTAKTDTKERARIIREQLAKESLVVNTKEYSDKFALYNSKILAAK